MRSFCFFKNMHRFKGTWKGWFQPVILVLILIVSIFGFCDANVSSKITCDDDEMRVDIKGSHIKEAYLLGLKNYPDASCQPDRVSSDLLKFRLSLRDFYRCGTAQILNKITGARTFYNRIVIEEADGTDSEILVKCQQEGTVLDPVSSNHLNATIREKRDVLPAGFVEEDAPFVEEKVFRAPEPMLRMAVKQDGRVIGQELLVSPGAPLSMEVSLDSISSSVYGIIMSHLDVTDNTEDQSEVILLNACSVDPYLFENFFTSDGDLLTAKFRAFKFPDSNYVLFRGTVNVCLGTCQPSECSNGQIGYGRRRRSIDTEKIHGLYEVKMTTLIRISNPDPSNPQERAVLGRLNPYSTGRFELGNNEAKLERDTIQAEFVTASASHTSPRQLSNPIITFSLSLVSLSLASLLSIWHRSMLF